MENLNKNEKTFLGHPRGLLTLFQTEFWERFSYYGMRVILLYYLYSSTTSSNAGLGISKPLAMSIVSIYGSLVFLSAILGGWLADRLLGTSRTILVGGILITLGHVALATPFGLFSLFISLFLIIIGTGMLKTNVSNMVGKLYSKEDTRRDAGFNIFVMGINIGALIAPLIVGTVGQGVNYHLGFSLAAIGMIFALFAYCYGRIQYFPNLGKEPSNPLDEKTKYRFFILFTTIIVIIVVGLWILYQVSPINFINNFIKILSAIGIIVPIIYFVLMFTSKEVEKEERSKLKAYIPFFLSAIVFWTIEEQSQTVIAVWGESRSNLDITGFGFNFHIQPSWYLMLNSLFIILLTPIIVKIWAKMGDRQPSAIVKFGIGLVLTGASYLIMTLPGLLNGTSGKASSLWLVLMFAVQMTGELLVSPVGLSISTKLAPLAFQSQMMAMWFLSDSTSQAINSQITPLFNPTTEVPFFAILGIIAVIVGALLVVIKKPILRLMGISA